MQQQPQQQQGGSHKRKADEVVVEKAPVINHEAYYEQYDYSSAPTPTAAYGYGGNSSSGGGSSSTYYPANPIQTSSYNTSMMMYGAMSQQHQHQQHVPQTTVVVSAPVQLPQHLINKKAPAALLGPQPQAAYRKAAGKAWVDPTLAEWSDSDYRIFAGDLGNEVNDEILKNAFSKFPSFLKAKVIRDPKTTKSRGYGFVSFSDARDYVKALKEMNGKYIGGRPCKLRKSTWKQYTDEETANAAQQKYNKPAKPRKGKPLSKKPKI